jgi:cytochrome c556
MSAHGFHVHGPHDHEVEHAAQGHGAHARDPFAARVAVMTAIFATIGALEGYMVGETQNDALLFKNDSAIRRAEASDQWNFYQAKSSKQNLAELGAVLAPVPEASRFKSEADRYNREKQEIMAKAQEREKLSSELEAKSEASMHLHHRWAQGMTLIQIAIALGAISLLTRSRWLEFTAFGAAGVSVVVSGLALMHV